MDREVDSAHLAEAREVLGELRRVSERHSAAFVKAVELLEYAELGDLDIGSLYPVAASSYNINIITIDGSTGDDAGSIRWFGGYELERYDNFAAFFDAVIEMFEADRDRPVEDRPY